MTLFFYLLHEFRNISVCDPPLNHFLADRTATQYDRLLAYNPVVRLSVIVDLISPRPGVEPVTFRSRVRRRTGAPPRLSVTLCILALMVGVQG